MPTGLNVLVSISGINRWDWPTRDQNHLQYPCLKFAELIIIIIIIMIKDLLNSFFLVFFSVKSKLIRS